MLISKESTDNSNNNSKEENIKTKLQNSNRKILIIGLGQIGFSNAEYMNSIGLNVDGFDSSKESIQRALDAGVISKAVSSFEDYDYYVICISTHLPSDMFVPNLDNLYDLVERLATEGKPGALIGIDCTVPRGTSEKIKKIVKHNLHVAHVPHRFKIHEKNDQGTYQPRVLGASDVCCENKAAEFYHDILGIPLFRTSMVDVAELCKIVENAHKYLEIAFAKEMKMVCDGIGIDFDELRKAINTKWNVKVREVNDSTDTRCPENESELIVELNRRFRCSLIETAKQVDRQYRSHIGQERVLQDNAQSLNGVENYPSLKEIEEKIRSAESEIISHGGEKMLHKFTRLLETSSMLREQRNSLISHIKQLKESGLSYDELQKNLECTENNLTVVNIQMSKLTTKSLP